MQRQETRFKSFIARLPTLLIGGLLLPAFSVFAASADTDYELNIRPSICVSYDSEAPCEMTLNINWTGGNGTPVCLNTAGDEDFITCWSNVTFGDIEVPYANSANMVYQLVSRQNNRLLADAEVQVISRDLRDSRQRRRHVWSIL